MGAAFFYHLTRSPLEEALPMILTRALDRGWRVEVRGREAALMDRLDAQLWLRPEEGFLPHGRAGGPHDADQPVLLTAGEPAANEAACVICVDEAPLEAGEVAALERACVIFDGGDAAAVEGARDRWRTLTGAGCAAEYWSQESGRWEKKAEAG